MEIGDWSAARELDVKAAAFIHEEILKRETEREQRDREFWIAAFGGEPSEPEIELSTDVGVAQLGSR